VTTSMRLNARLARLEEAARRHAASEPCRWHAPLVIYPPTLPRDGHGRVIVPPCEEPRSCPGAAVAQIYLPERRSA
jgi:hypothetical protein